jgi:hypothetical protein
MDDLSRFARHARPRAVLVVGLMPALLAGCGGGVEQEKGLVPVSGRVTFDGGPWPKPGQIIFTPVGADKNPDASSVSYVAPFGTDGSFTVAHPGANGMKPGKYWVSVQSEEVPSEMPAPGQKVEDKSIVPKPYRNPETSGLKYSVEAGNAPPANFDVKSK